METSSTSSIISALGGGSGVDMAKLAADLAEARFAARRQQLESRNDLLETRISSASELRSQLSQLSSALGDRIRTGDLAPEPIIGNSGVARVALTPGIAPRGSFSLEVTQIASAQHLVGNPIATSTDPVGEGTLTLRFGAVDGAVFNEDISRAPVDITVSAGQTLSDVANAINAADTGITAYVANGTNGAQLVLKGPEGANNGFVLDAAPTAPGSIPPVAGDLEYLAWNPASDAGELRATAQDAAFLFDGVSMTATSNKPDGLPQGLVLTLTGTNIGAPTQISFTDRSSNISAVMGDFVAALNDITGFLAEVAAPLGGELGSDPGARSLKRELSQLASRIVMPSVPEGEPRNLSDLGLVTNRDGTFKLDPDRLASALENNRDAVAAMFTTGLYGVYATFDDLSRRMGILSDPGSLGGSVQRYTAQAEKLDERIATIAEQQEKLRAQLATSFVQADRRVAQSQSTLAFLKNQIAAWNSQNN